MLLEQQFDDVLILRSSHLHSPFVVALSRPRWRTLSDYLRLLAFLETFFAAFCATFLAIFAGVFFAGAFFVVFLVVFLASFFTPAARLVAGGFGVVPWKRSSGTVGGGIGTP
ncbi:hypothetical protein, partial [Actinopolymorpha pittospori]|uniref:hypothetical protein n=1 Tax=Actinopolymorpha pittospori TaxID=648752 RepID=UPI0031EEB945